MDKLFNSAKKVFEALKDPVIPEVQISDFEDLKFFEDMPIKIIEEGNLEKFYMVRGVGQNEETKEYFAVLLGEIGTEPLIRIIQDKDFSLIKIYSAAKEEIMGKTFYS